jgi:hypothetical protein
LFLVVFATIASFAITNFQQHLFVIVDSAYENLYAPMILPFKGASNLVILIFQIVVGIWNFIAKINTVVRQEVVHVLTHCPGYFDHFFESFVYVGQSLAALAKALGDWLSGELITPLNLEPFVAKLRLVVFDLSLRAQCTCPAENGLIAIFQTGLIDSETVVIDTFISEAVNTPLSVAQVILRALFVSATEGTYAPPDTGVVINHFVGAITAAEQIANQLFYNLCNVRNRKVQDVSQDEANTFEATWVDVSEVLNEEGVAHVASGFEDKRTVKHRVRRRLAFELNDGWCVQHGTDANAYHLQDEHRGSANH